MKRYFFPVMLLILAITLGAPAYAKDEGKILKMREGIMNFQNKGNLEIRNFNFCSEIISFGSYTALKSPVLKQGESLTAYFEPGSYFTEKKDGLYRIHLIQDIMITSADGKEVLLDTKDFTSLSLTSKMPVLDVYFKNTITQISPGEYLLKIVLRDMIKNTTAKGEFKFQVQE